MIRVENVTKYYGKHLAVDGISFAVDRGGIVGFLGANGAGKSTTMRMITGYLVPTSGDIYVGDYHIVRQSIDGRRLLGYLPETVPLYTDMTVRKYLTFVGELRDLDDKKIRVRIDEVSDQCGLESYADTCIRKLSKGYRQRVGIAQAIIHDPPVLILDEPTVGIDPIQLTQIRSLIRDLGKDRTILLSSHDLSEVSMVCDRVVIIKAGRIVARDSIDNLSALISNSARLRLRAKGSAERIAQALAGIDAVKSVSMDDDAFIIEYGVGSEPQPQIVETMLANDWPLLSLETVAVSLEDIFLTLAAGKDV